MTNGLPPQPQPVDHDHAEPVMYMTFHDTLEKLLFMQYLEHRATAMQIAQAALAERQFEHALGAIHTANATALQIAVSMKEWADMRVAQARRFPVQPNEDPDVPELDA